MTTCKSTVISNIQRFSLDDGPGIRTTVFLKGCNLECAWCHNPECINYFTEIEFLESKCTACGRCLQACASDAKIDGTGKTDRNLCTRCGKCASVCRNGALEIVGEEMSVDDIMKIILKDRPYYKESGGGVTVSGGDPMTQPGFLAELLRACKDVGLHTAVDTAGNVPQKNFDEVLEFADLFLYDIKMFDSQKHKEYTGVDNEQIWKNLNYLNDRGARIFVRMPIIKGINDSLDDIRSIAERIAKMDSVESIKLLPYHNYGEGKYHSLDMKYSIHDNAVPDKEFMREATEIVKAAGINLE